MDEDREVQKLGTEIGWPRGWASGILCMYTSQLDPGVTFHQVVDEIDQDKSQRNAYSEKIVPLSLIESVASGCSTCTTVSAASSPLAAYKTCKQASPTIISCGDRDGIHRSRLP